MVKANSFHTSLMFLFSRPSRYTVSSSIEVSSSLRSIFLLLKLSPSLRVLNAPNHIDPQPLLYIRLIISRVCFFSFPGNPVLLPRHYEQLIPLYGLSLGTVYCFRPTCDHASPNTVAGKYRGAIPWNYSRCMAIRKAFSRIDMLKCFLSKLITDFRL